MRAPSGRRTMHRSDFGSAKVRWLWAVLLLGAVQLATAQSNPRVTIIVTDSSGGVVPYATLMFRTGHPILANDSGSALVANLGAGRHAIEVRRLGFRPVTLEFSLRSDTTVHVTLNRIAQSLEAMTVTARSVNRLARSGVYEHMLDLQHGLLIGAFVTAEEIETRHPPVISQMLEGRYPGVSVTAGGVPISSFNGGCAMTVYVDGGRYDGGTTMGGGSPGKMYFRPPAGYAGPPIPSEHTIDRVVSPDEVAAIEIYPRATTAPAVYQHLNGGCGIIAIWTK